VPLGFCYSLVTPKTSSREVNPNLTLLRPDCRKERTPSSFCLFSDFQGTAIAQNDALNFFADGHDLVDADPPLVAVVAGMEQPTAR
jgi:hypothetical protein